MTSGQPKPKPNDHPASWGLVHGDLQSMGEYEVMGDIAERHLMGIQKYGTPLQPFNGRDSLRDAREESMDLVVYLKNVSQELPPLVPPGLEHRMVSRMYHTALGLMCALKDYEEWKANQAGLREAARLMDVAGAIKEGLDAERNIQKGTSHPKREGPVIYRDRYPAPPKPQEDPQVSPGPIHQAHVQEAHLGHPVDPQGITVEVANQVPIVFIPDQIQGQLREDLERWKKEVEGEYQKRQAEQDIFPRTLEDFL